MGAKGQLCRLNKSIALIYSMLTIVNNTILNTRNLLMVTLCGHMLSSFTIYIFFTMCIKLSLCIP